MAYEFQKLADVEAVEEFPEEGASVLIEHEGDIKKCPADGIGGGESGIPLLRITEDPETGDAHLELDDGRTADEFVASFEKDGVCLLLFGHTESSDKAGITGDLFEQISLEVAEKIDDNPPPQFATVAGGIMYVYRCYNDSMYLTNIDMKNIVLMDHYEFVMMD